MMRSEKNKKLNMVGQKSKVTTNYKEAEENV